MSIDATILSRSAHRFNNQRMRYVAYARAHGKAVQG